MIEAGGAVLTDVEGALEHEAVRLQRAARATSWWRGPAAQRARRLWDEQARHVTRAASALREANQALRAYEAEAADAQQRLARAEATLRATPPLDQLLDPAGARARADAAEAARRRATADLDDAARRLAARLATLEADARMPAAAPGPCAPPPPAPPATGWARAAEVVFGSAEPVLWDLIRCRPIYLVEAGGSGVLRGLARRQAKGAARERLIADAAEGVLRNRDNDHAFKHADQLFGRKDITQAQRVEWARMIRAGLQSSKTFRYETGALTGIGRLHWEHGRYWVVVQDRTSGIVRTAFMPNASQLAAILRMMGRG